MVYPVQRLTSISWEEETELLYSRDILTFKYGRSVVNDGKTYKN